jgi:2-amino-4-hydroxy-6-hydroxymethyldihydropteridine diphosphokinase
MKTAGNQTSASSRLGMVVIGFGANIGERAAIVGMFRAAVLLLTAKPQWKLLRTSSLYYGPGIDAIGPHYFNGGGLFRVPANTSPTDLIHHVLDVETTLGRERPQTGRNAPRTIDLDVLWWDGQFSTWPGPPLLQVPHPRLLQRRFAVEPCTELLGGAALVVADDPIQQTFDDALTACLDQPLETRGQWLTLEPDESEKATSV